MNKLNIELYNIRYDLIVYIILTIVTFIFVSYILYSKQKLIEFYIIFYDDEEDLENNRPKIEEVIKLGFLNTIGTQHIITDYVHLKEKLGKIKSHTFDSPKTFREKDPTGEYVLNRFLLGDKDKNSISTYSLSPVNIAVNIGEIKKYLNYQNLVEKKIFINIYTSNDANDMVENHPMQETNTSTIDNYSCDTWCYRNIKIRDGQFMFLVIKIVKD